MTSPSGLIRERLTQIEAARRLKITPRRLRTLSGRGDISRADDGSYPWPLIREEHKELLREADRRRGRPDPGSDFARARARREAARASVAELDLAQRTGEVVPLSIIIEVVGPVLDQLRSRIVGIPGTWPPELDPCDGPRELQEVLRRLSNEILQDLQGVGDALEARAKEL